jgi:hypothetical protein
MTAAKFKPLVFPVLCFALTNEANKLIIMILDDFCVLPAEVRVRVTFRLTVSQSIRLGVKPILGLLTRNLSLSGVFY